MVTAEFERVVTMRWRGSLSTLFGMRGKKGASAITRRIGLADPDRSIRKVVPLGVIWLEEVKETIWDGMSLAHNHYLAVDSTGWGDSTDCTGARVA